MAEKQVSLFERLYAINVNDKVEKKGNLSYVSWPNAWAEIKKVVPDATYTIYERDTQYGPVNYFTDGKTCWVKTGMTLNGLEYVEMLPVMDFSNRSIPAEKVTANDVNKAIQRSLTKAAARHGLGLYIYAGEDLPEEEAAAKKNEKQSEPLPDPIGEPGAVSGYKIVGVDSNGPIMEKVTKKANVSTVDGVPGW